MSQPQNAIEANGLRKVYRRRGAETVALHQFDLNIPRGSFFGLLGPNGAGKSTFINILAGRTNKTAGTVTVWGHDLVRETRGARLSIGVVPQELVLDPYFTAREALEAQAGYFGLRANERRTAKILETVGLPAQAKTYPRALSGGMRRRLMVAKALVHSPPIVILDAPTAGVDVELRQQLWSHLRELTARGTTVVLDDLSQALYAGTIGGAALDVFETEPLPEASPLWAMANVMVSPHMSGDYEEHLEDVVALFAANFERYQAGQPLVNVVDKALGFATG